MKLIGSVLVFVVFCQSIYCQNSEREARAEFIQWREKYDKTYSTLAEQRQAFLNFFETRKETEAHNQKFKLGQVNFRRSLNQFADLSSEDLKEIATGFAQPPLSLQGRAVTIIRPGMFPPGPKDVDWKAKGFVTPVKDQGFYCSCCWAFSAIGALESHLLIKYGKNYSLSEQQLLDCNRNELTGNWGCKGGSQGSAYVYIMKMGIETSNTYPYLEDLRHDGIYPCHYNKSNTVTKVKGYLRIRPKDEKTLKDVVATKGPVAFAFDGSLESFMYYENGIYDDPNCPSGLGHSSVIVGYGTVVNNGTSIDYWLCKNSWSVDWGEQGYFRMIRGKNLCGMTNYLILPDLE